MGEVFPPKREDIRPILARTYPSTCRAVAGLSLKLTNQLAQVTLFRPGRDRVSKTNVVTQMSSVCVCVCTSSHMYKHIQRER